MRLGYRHGESVSSGSIDSWRMLYNRCMQMEPGSRDKIPKRRGNKRKLWDDEDLDALEALLVEHGSLLSPYISSKTTARYRASLLRSELLDRGKIKCSQRVWPEDDGYRWAVVLEQDG